MNKLIALLEVNSRTLWQAVYVAISILGWLCLLGWLIPWVKNHFLDWFNFLAIIILFSYAIAIVGMYEGLFEKPVVNQDRSKEPT